MSCLQRTYEWLNNKFPDFHNINFDAKSTVIVGKPQAGKSYFSFGIALYNILNDRPVILVLRNFSKDAIQMLSKSKLFSKEYSEFMGNEKYNLDTVLLINYENVLDSLIGKNKKLIIIMNNSYQLRNINRLISENNIENVCVLVDEADELGYNMNIEKNGDIKPLTYSSIEYNILLNNSSYIFEISATVFDILYGNKNLTNKNIVVVRPPSTYKGIRDGIQFNYISEGKTDEGKTDESKKYNFEDTYLELSRLPYFTNDRYSCIINHPVIVLHKTFIWQKNHDNFMKFFMKNDILKEIWTVIIEDSRCYKIYSKNLEGKVISIVNDKFRDVNNNGIFELKSNKLDIQIILQWLLDNGGAKKFGHIVIKTGRQAGRSRSYVSSNGCWHLSHEYYIPSKTNNNIADLVQSIRLCHNRPDSIPLVLYAPLKICTDLQKGDVLQEEQLERLQNMIVERNTNIQLKEEVWTKQKIPKTKICKHKMNKDFKPKKIIGYDGGWGKQEYVNDKPNKTKISLFLNIMNPEQLYTKEEILEHLKSAGYKQPKSMFYSLTNLKGNWGRGSMLTYNETSDKWKLK